MLTDIEIKDSVVKALKERNPKKILMVVPDYGYNKVGGEEIFFIPNPALGLWIKRVVE